MSIGVASRLSQRVTIEQKQTQADELGGQQVSWVPLATVFAQVTPLRSGGRERIAADQVRAVAGYRVQLRRRDDLDASMRLVWNSRILNIHSLHDMGELMECLTYEEQL
jgi:SPP1 family predicted phage head-tail adaptor